MKQILSLWDACPQGGKHRRSVFLRLLLFVCMLLTAQAGWADTELVNINFAAEETVSLTASEDTKTIGGVEVYFKGCSNITKGSGVTLSSNMSSSNYYIRIPLNGVNENTIQVTVTHPSNESPQWRYQTSNTTSISSYSSKTGTTISITNFNGTSGYLYLGANNSSSRSIKSVVVTTPSSSSAPTLTGASSDPAASATNVAVSGTGFLKFSKNLSSIDDSKITISPSTNGETLSSIAIDGTDASKVNYTWSGLQKNTVYTINVAANAVSDDTDGNAATSLSFTTLSKTALTGAWSNANPTFENGASSPTIPTFAVSGGGTLGTDYSVAYSLQTDGGNVSVNSNTGITNINTSVAGTSVVRATVSVINTADYSMATTTYDCNITVNTPAATLTTLSNYEVDLTNATKFDAAKNADADYNYSSTSTVQVKGGTEVVEFGNGVTLKKGTGTSDTKIQRLMLNPNTKANDLTGGVPNKYFFHIKVAANSKVTVDARGDGINLAAVDGLGNAFTVVNPSVGSTRSYDHIIRDTGSGEKDIYFYVGTDSKNITLYKVNVQPTYVITSNINGSGTVTTKIGDETVTRAASGETVTITATPATGAQLSSLTVTKTDGGASVDVTSSNTFTMPSEAVTVNATFGAGSAAAPTFLPGASTISTTQTITLTSATENANIYYTTNGDTPTSSSTKYTGPFILGNSATVKAIAYDSSNANPSAVSSKTYTVDAVAPTLSSTTPPNGATGRGTSGTISLTFNEAVSVANASGITISPSTGVTWGTATVDASDNKKVNIAVSGLANNTQYTVNIASGAVTDVVGNAYAGSSFSFTTAAAATTVVLERRGSSSSTTFSNGTDTFTGASYSGTSSVSGGMSSLSSDQSSSVYRTGATSSITITLNSTSASKIVIGATSSGASSTRTLSAVKVNGTDVTSSVTLSPSPASVTGNNSVQRITVDGLNVLKGETVQFTFDDKVYFYYFEVTSGSADVPLTFTTSPENNAEGVAVNAAVTLTADRDLTAVGGTIAGTLNGAACTFTLGGDNRTLTLTKAANFANATQYTVVLSAGQVQGPNGVANTAKQFTFTTVAAVLPTIAFNSPTTSMTVGGGTVTNAATTTNDGGATVTYTSSNTSVATVAAGGVVTAVAAGTTTITASMTVGSTEYTARYTMTVNAASVGSTKWDFTTLSSDEIAAMRANVNGSTKTLKENSSDKYFSNTGSFSKFTNDSGADLNVTDGLTFGKSGGSLSAADIRYFYGDGDKRIFIKSSNEYIQLPSQAAGTEITVSWRADGGSRTLTATNATINTGSSATIGTSGNSGTSTFTVDAAGTVQFKVNGSVSLFSITVGSSVTVAAPTIAPASGTHEGENNKSVTFTQNADNTGGTLTTHYVVGTAAATSAATVAAGTSVTSATPETIDLSSYETDVVISAVTKYVDGSSNTFYSPITTATYTYAGKATPKVQGSNMILHHGDFADIVNSITMTDKAGNPLLFGNEEIPNYSDYFTFTYAIDSDSESQAASTNVTLSEGRLTCAEGSAVTTGNGIKINITAEPKAAAAEYVKPGTVYGSLYVQVTAKESSGYEYVGLYWDKDFSAASELKEGVDYEVQQISGVNYFVLNNVPNSRMLYLKNTGAVDIDDLCFFYKQNATVPTMSLNHVDEKNGDQYKYRHGIPLITSNDGDGIVWIMIAGYKQVVDAETGKSSWSRDGSFLRLKVNITARAKQTAPRYEPTDASAHMNTSKPATAYTVDDNNEGKPNDEFEILSKFTSSGKELPILTHVNTGGTIYGVGSTSVYSTEVAKRQISGVQTVKKTEDGKTYYYISNMSKLLYTFDFGTTLKLSEYEIDVTTDDKAITSGEITEPTVTATYWNKKTSKDVEITYANEYIRYEVVKSPKTDGGADGVTVNATTGEISVNPKTLTGEAVIKVTYLGGFDEMTSAVRTGSAASNEPIEITTDKTRTGYTGAASTTYTINIQNTAEYVPVINPTGKKFANTLEVTVSAPDANHFVRYMVANGDDGTNPPTAEAVKTGGKLIDAGNRSTETIGANAAIGDKITVYAVAYFGEYTSRVVQETYEKVKPLPKPVFNPDGTETPYYYYNTAKLLEVTIMGTDGADIFYTFDDPNVSTASTPYDGQKKARVEGSKTIYAIAVKDGLQSEVAASRYVWTLNIDAPVFYLGNDQTILYPATAKTKEVTRTTDINLKATQGDIYYTLDGSDPSTDNGIKFTAGTPINLVKSVTAKAIAIDGDAISPITTMNFTIPEPAASDNDLWEAVEETTPGGTLPADGRVISIANGSPKAVKYITATFGGGHREVLGNTAWSKISIGEESQGSALDGVGKYSISVGSDVADETGAIYNHANAAGGSLEAVSARTFKIPAQGAFVRFEPERDGELTIWALQSGALHYTTKGDFCDKFIRRRPVYLIDEQGKSVTAKVTPVSSARLSRNWDNLKPDEFLDKNQGSQNGDVNTFYTSAENTAIYAMYEKILADNTGFGVGKDIHPVPMHTTAIQGVVGTNGTGDNVTDNTGYVMLSGGYVKYTFDVKAGKTYYFFGSRTKLGIRGFRFVADDTTPENITLTEEATTNSTAISGANATTRHTTGFDRKFKANTWAALVLPFSLSETQTKQIFGDDVEVMHLQKVENYCLYMLKHYYQMVVAGTPVFIKPSQEVDFADLDQYVRIESTAPQSIDLGGFNFTGYYDYDAARITKGDYYLNGSGNLSQRTSGTGALKSLRSILKSTTGNTSARLSMAAGVLYEVDQQPTGESVVTPIEIVYDDITGDITVINDDTIYNINGQVVRKNAKNLDGLPKGIYIVNGHKVAVK